MMNVRMLPVCAAPGTMIAARAPHSTTSSLCSTSGRQFQVPKLQIRAQLQHSHRAEGQQVVRRTVVAYGLKAKEDYDSSFDLAEDNRAALEGLLASDTFCAQASRFLLLHVTRSHPQITAWHLRRCLPCACQSCKISGQYTLAICWSVALAHLSF